MWRGRHPVVVLALALAAVYALVSVTLRYNDGAAIALPPALAAGGSDELDAAPYAGLPRRGPLEVRQAAAAAVAAAMRQAHGPGEECLAGCLACNLVQRRAAERWDGPGPAPMLFVRERDDGAGVTLSNVFRALSLSLNSGFAFGGLLPGRAGLMHVSHGVNTSHFVRQVFGAALPYVQEAPEHAVEVEILASSTHETLRDGLVAAWHQGSDAVVVHLQSPYTGFFRDNQVTADGNDAPPAVLQRLVRQSAVCGLLSRLPGVGRRLFAPSALTVAIHVRLGDVLAHMREHPLAPVDMRYVPMGYYSALLATLQIVLPTADIHIFTEQTDDSRVDELRLPGVYIHEDEVGPPEAFAHMLSADILVPAHSRFSGFATLLTRACIVQVWSIRERRNRFWTDNQGILLEATDNTVAAMLPKLRALEACLRTPPAKRAELWHSPIEEGPNKPDDDADDGSDKDDNGSEEQDDGDDDGRSAVRP